MDYRLLVDFDVLVTLRALPKQSQDRLMEHFRRLQTAPETMSDGGKFDRSGRRVEVSFHAGFAVYYWIDDADQHVKILELRLASRR